MARGFHLSLGVVLSVLYVFLVFHSHRALPGLEFLPSPLPVTTLRNGSPEIGWLVAFGLPIVAIICFIFPDRLMWRLSPRTPPDYDYLLTPGFWYVIGYFTLIVGAGILLLFRSPV